MSGFFVIIMLAGIFSKKKRHLLGQRASYIKGNMKLFSYKSVTEEQGFDSIELMVLG